MNIFTLLGKITLDGLESVKTDLQSVSEESAKTKDAMQASGDGMQNSYAGMAQAIQTANDAAISSMQQAAGESQAMQSDISGSMAQTEDAAGQMQDMYTAMAEGMQRDSEETAAKLQAEYDRATAQVESDFDQLEKNIAKSADNIDKDLSKSFKNMAIAGAAVTAAITGVGVSAANRADDISDWSIKLGISTDAVQELAYVASQNSLDLSSMGQAVRGQTEFLGKATDAQKEYSDALAAANDLIAEGATQKQLDESAKHLDDLKAKLDASGSSIAGLGLNLSDLQGMNPEEQFFALANAVSGLDTVQERTAAATEIWGSRVGQNLLPMINQGAAGIQELRDKFAGLGTSMTEEQIANLTSLKDTWIDMKTTAVGFANTLGAEVAPVVKFVFGDMIIPAFKLAKEVIDAIPGPLKTATTGAILAGAGFLTLAGGVGTVITRLPKMIDNVKLGITFLTGFKFAGDEGGKSLIGLASNLIKTGVQFVIYVAKLIPVIAAQALAWATNWPAGTISFLATAGAIGAIAWGLTEALGGKGGGEVPGYDAAESAAISAEADSRIKYEEERTGGEATGGAELPQADSGGTFTGPLTGYPVMLHGTETVTKEPVGATTENHYHFPGNIIIQHVADLDDFLSQLQGRQQSIARGALNQ